MGNNEERENNRFKVMKYLRSFFRFSCSVARGVFNLFFLSQSLARPFIRMYSCCKNLGHSFFYTNINGKSQLSFFKKNSLRYILKKTKEK